MVSIPGQPAEPAGREVKKLRPIANAAIEAGNIYAVLQIYPLTGVYLVEQLCRDLGNFSRSSLEKGSGGFTGTFRRPRWNSLEIVLWVTH